MGVLLVFIAARHRLFSVLLPASGLLHVRTSEIFSLSSVCVWKIAETLQNAKRVFIVVGIVLFLCCAAARLQNVPTNEILGGAR